jgi:hypothetical protein
MTFSRKVEFVTEIEFLGICKQLKIYPSVVHLDTVKKVVLRTPEYWQTHGKTTNQMSSTCRETGSLKSYFDFADFIRAFKVSSA